MNIAYFKTNHENTLIYILIYMEIKNFIVSEVKRLSYHCSFV